MTFQYSPYRKLPGEKAEPLRFTRPKTVSSDDLNKLPVDQRVRIIFREMEDMMNDAADKIREDAPDFPGAKDYIDYLRLGAYLAGTNTLRKVFDINHSLGIILTLTRRSSTIMQEVQVWLERNENQGQGTTG